MRRLSSVERTVDLEGFCVSVELEEKFVAFCFASLAFRITPGQSSCGGLALRPGRSLIYDRYKVCICRRDERYHSTHHILLFLRSAKSRTAEVMRFASGSSFHSPNKVPAVQWFSITTAPVVCSEKRADDEIAASP